tara:strand:+ start:19391 stop:20938 length:1548 start_codon:yes stop_codon:yes gene_type:complete
MAALIVNNVLSSSVNVTYSYVTKEELFGYEVVGTYEIDISDINIEDHDTVLIKGRDAIVHAYGRENIVARIGADDYINGRIQSFDFEAGALVGSEVVTITIQESRRLDDYSNTSFTRYIPNPQLVEDFTESYEFSRSGGDYNSKRKISLKYKQEAGDQFLNDAKVFLTNYYFVNRPDLGYQEDGISENARLDDKFRGLISESYDLIGLSVDLTEDVSTSFVDSAKNVGRKETQSINITKQGFIEKTFNIELSALRQDSENVLNKAIGEIIDELKVSEASEFGSPSSISKGISKDGYTATLNVKFTTDSSSQDEVISYNGAESKAGKFKEYNLSIQYNSLGKNNKEKFINSKAVWVREQPFQETRIARLFHPTVPIYEKARNTSFVKSEGVISENIIFTTDDSYKNNDDGVLKLKKTLNKTHQINRIEKFLDLQNLKEQVVTNNLKTVGNASVSAQAVVSQSAGIYKAKTTLEEKTEELTELVNEDITHITSDSITLNLGEGEATRTINYIFIKDE